MPLVGGRWYEPWRTKAIAEAKARLAGEGKQTPAESVAVKAVEPEPKAPKRVRRTKAQIVADEAKRLAIAKAKADLEAAEAEAAQGNTDTPGPEAAPGESEASSTT